MAKGVVKIMASRGTGRGVWYVSLWKGEFNVEGAELTLEAEKLATSLKLAYLSSGHSH